MSTIRRQSGAATSEGGSGSLSDPNPPPPSRFDSVSLEPQADSLGPSELEVEPQHYEGLAKMLSLVQAWQAGLHLHSKLRMDPRSNGTSETPCLLGLDSGIVRLASVSLRALLI
jgi:hypothetical protein